MTLEMYINDNLVDSMPLSLTSLNNAKDRDLYIQGAIHHLKEKWDDMIGENSTPEFFIRIASGTGTNSQMEK